MSIITVKKSGFALALVLTLLNARSESGTVWTSITDINTDRNGWRLVNNTNRAAGFRFFGPEPISLVRFTTVLAMETPGKVNVDLFVNNPLQPIELAAPDIRVANLATLTLGSTMPQSYSFRSIEPILLKPGAVYWFVIGTESGSAKWANSDSFGTPSVAGIAATHISRKFQPYGDSRWALDTGFTLLPAMEIEVSNVVPEPSTLAFFSTGMLILLTYLYFHSVRTSRGASGEELREESHTKS